MCVNTGKVKNGTFKQIHELHKDVVRADMITSAIQNKLSVATGTDILTERQHNSTKLQRQLNTLSSQLSSFNVGKLYKNLNQILDIQIAMSGTKLKICFSVFIQTFCETLIDAELTHRPLSCNAPTDHACMSFVANTPVQHSFHHKLTLFLLISGYLCIVSDFI